MLLLNTVKAVEHKWLDAICFKIRIVRYQLNTHLHTHTKGRAVMAIALKVCRVTEQQL